jgi:hypothetical protein
VAAIAVNGGDNLVELLLLDRTFHSIDAVGGRTPPKIVLVINVRPCEKLLISVLEILCDEKFQALGIDDVVALLARTANTSSLSFVLDLLC